MKCLANLGIGAARARLVVALSLGAAGCFSDPGMPGMGAAGDETAGESGGADAETSAETGASESSDASGTGAETGTSMGMDLGGAGTEETGGDPGECVWIRLGENSGDDVGGVTVDTWVDEEAPTMNNGADDDLRADGASAQGLTEISLVRFEASSLPMGTVIDALLYLSTTEDDGSESSPGSQFSVYEVQEPWVEGEATWLEASSGVAWSVPGCAGDPCRGEVELVFFEPTEQSHTYALAFTPTLVETWRDAPEDNHGLLLATPAANGGIFHSSEGKDTSLRPALEVQVCP